MFKRFAPFQGPKSWHFKDPDTGMEFQGKDLQELSSRVRMYRAQNELPQLDYLETVIENWLCTQIENRGACEDRPKLKRGLIPSIKGGIAIITNFMYNSFVEQDVADDRAEICTTCPLNTFPDKTKFVEWSDKIAYHSVGDRRSKYHDQLGNCEGCGCPLKAKVWHTLPSSNLTPVQKIKMRKACERCWQLENK